MALQTPISTAIKSKFTHDTYILSTKLTQCMLQHFAPSWLTPVHRLIMACVQTHSIIAHQILVMKAIRGAYEGLVII